MSCKPSCGEPQQQTIERVVKQVLREWLQEGKLQAALTDCSDERLPQDARVARCSDVSDIICQLISEGDVCIPTPQTLATDCQNKTLTLTLSTGDNMTSDLSCLVDDLVVSLSGGTVADSQDSELPTTIVGGRQRLLGNPEMGFKKMRFADGSQGMVAVFKDIS